MEIDNEQDKARPMCAVVGVYGHPQASLLCYYMLHALQHRGQEATGITSFFKNNQTGIIEYATHCRNGLVMNVFDNPELLTEKLLGSAAIGHNRYATTGASIDSNMQPLNMRYKSGVLSLCHNGNLTNTIPLRRKLEEQGAIFHTTTDSELFLHLVARSPKPTQIEQVREALSVTKGAYSLCILTEEGLVAARDPYGVRPLSIGRIKLNPSNDHDKLFDDKYAYVVASETCAFDIIGAEEVRPIRHNEIVVIDAHTLETGEIKSYNIMPVTPEAKHCIFEYIYFSRPDSRIFGHNVDKVRRKLGKNLATESPANELGGEKATVISVPDSGNTAALGYARSNQKLGSEAAYEIGLIRSHYVGRTFIQPEQDKREFKVKTKFNTVKGVIKDRNIVVVDDSIVRGTTSKALVNLIRSAEPSQLHLRITSPPIISPCYYGMDFPNKNELISNYYNSEEEIAEALGVDSLHYLSVEGLMDSVPQDEGIGYCTACFTGEYPIPLENGVENK